MRSTILRPWPPRRAPRDELARGPARGPAPLQARAAGLAAAPPGAVVGTVWLARLPARGARGRPAASRRSPRSVSGRRSQPLARRHGQQAGATVGGGGNAGGSRRQWPPPRRT